MSWAQRRKATYVFGILIFSLVVFAIIVFVFLNKAPTCFDGKQNQGEAGIDCGGPCNILCRAEYIDPVVLWGPRWSKVLSSGTYNFLTYIQNPNVAAGAYNVPYNMKVYDRNDILLYQKNGVTYIPPNNNFVIFEDNINLHDKTPFRTKIEFTNGAVWQKMESQELNITAVSKQLIDVQTKPRLFVTLKNSTLKTIENIESVAILYDENNNAVAFSKTKVDSIDKDSTKEIVFTWPESFEQGIVRIDVVSKVLPN
jgi:hypothetical protein